MRPSTLLACCKPGVQSGGTMIKILYGNYDSAHFTREIKKADVAIDIHKKAGEVSVVTGSEVFIRRIMQAIRCGKLSCNDVRIMSEDFEYQFTPDGQFLDPWCDELFEITSKLVFDDYDEIKF